MVYEPLGFANMLNVLGIIAELVGFVLLLTQLQQKLSSLARKMGDSKQEIKQLDTLVIKWGIYFVIGGLVLQLSSVMLDSYFPNLYDDMQLNPEVTLFSIIIFGSTIAAVLIIVTIKYKKSYNERGTTIEQTKAKRQFTLLLISLIIGIVIGLTFGILTGISFNSNSLDHRIQDNGDFYVEIIKPTNSTYLIHYNAFSRNEENLEMFLNSEFNFPHDVYLILDECDDPDPKYYDQINQIQICYIFLDEVFQLYANYEQSIEKEGMYELINATTVFAIYHELAHALIEVFNLPVVGNEEIAADQFATFLLLPLIVQEGGVSYYISGPAQFFFEEMKEYETIDDIPFWQKHPIGEQRTINIICLAYGKLGPQPFEAINLEKKIPAQRLFECRSEFVTVSNNWKELLEDYLKPNSRLADDYLTRTYYQQFEN